MPDFFYQGFACGKKGDIGISGSIPFMKISGTDTGDISCLPDIYTSFACIFRPSTPNTTFDSGILHLFRPADIRCFVETGE